MSREGWICPVCGRGLSPFTSECSCYLNRPLTSTSPYTQQPYTPQPFSTGTPLPLEHVKITCDTTTDEGTKNV